MHTIDPSTSITINIMPCTPPRRPSSAKANNYKVNTPKSIFKNTVGLYFDKIQVKKVGKGKEGEESEGKFLGEKDREGDGIIGVRNGKSVRKIINCTPKAVGKLATERPQTAIVKKSRRRSWHENSTKIPLFSNNQIIFKQSENVENLQECLAFLVPFSKFVRLVDNQDQLLFQPISNQYTIKIFGRVSINDKTYFVVQNLQSESIRNVLQFFGPFREQMIRVKIRDLICGVLHCHSRGIVHNRLNIDTVFLNQNGKMLIDFVKTSQNQPSEQEKKKYYHYFSPELLSKKSVMESCDVWAVGSLCLFMLTGRLQNNPLHPYTYPVDSSPDSAPIEVQKLREQCLKYTENKSLNYDADIEIHSNDQISKEAKKFIVDCLRINLANRPSLQNLLFYDFLNPNTKG